MSAPAHQEKGIVSEQEAFGLPEQQCGQAEGVGQAGTARAVWGRAAAEPFPHPNTQLCTAYSPFSATWGTSVPLWEHME